MDRRKTAFATILLASAVTSHSSVPPLHAQGMSDPSERCEKLAGQVMGEVCLPTKAASKRNCRHIVSWRA
jgi:hypothetical protein